MHLPVLHLYTHVLTTLEWNCLNFVHIQKEKCCWHPLSERTSIYTKTAKLFSQPTLIQLRKLNASIQRSNTLTFQ